jgi:hypothetical protein
MGEKADLIERHIQQQRGEFGNNVLELKQKVRRSVDWRAQVDERPLTMIGLAFAGGVFLSVLLDGRRGYSMPRLSSDDQPPYRSQAHSETWEVLKGAALGLAATKLKDVVEELLPGFQDEYRKAEAGRRPS